METTTSLRYLVVPWIAPASPAFVVGVEFFRDLAYIQHWHIALAGLAAVSLAGTIELGGAFAAKGFTTFWSQRSWVRMGIAFVALLGYAYFGITLTWGTTLWPVFVFVTLLYLVIASIDTHQEQRRETAQEQNLALQIAKQKASEARAKARMAKFSGSTPENAPKINEAVKRYLDNAASPQDEKIENIAAGAGVSTSTASIHKKRYLQ